MLKRFLPSVIRAANHYRNLSGAPTEIIVVDDGSTDDTVEWLIREQKAVGNERPSELDELPASQTTLRVVRNEANLGFGETCNRGFEAAQYGLVFLLNNDVEVSEDAIAPLVENFRDESVFAAHCRVFELESKRECGTGKLGEFARGFIRVHRSYAVLDELYNLRMAGSPGLAALYSIFAGGGSAMFDRKRFLEIGGFEPLLSPFYWEDVELSYRAWKRGYVVVYEPRSVVHHRVSSTIGKLKPSNVRKIEQRNRLIYHWVHLHDKWMLASHIVWVALLAITSPLRFKIGFISSLAAALKRLPEIRKRRREEKLAAKRSDREVFEAFAILEKRDDLFAYDDYAELERLNSDVADRRRG